ncbi:hypothetical protein QBC32DRAFT_106991 [Pseudoneurospora amorphoporcata]|uniref:Uncharacterized protein n=1 Tax=Pseudoneurospora amorphoporcata TaxID=241081 RepID=A0AAN6NXE9_9PEZI|nr:hypothetical protein QBC32DRAFT_106991 [Pseudoneurospora amorphoporcata]
MSASIPYGHGNGMDGFINPALLTLKGAVSTQDFAVDLNDCLDMGDGGSAVSPSVVESLSTCSSLSSYAGSVTGSPNDAGYSPQGTEQDALVVAQYPMSDAPGVTMHDMAASTGQHGASEVTPVSWDMGFPMSSNEMLALQNDFCKMLDQMQSNMSQAQEGFDPDTTRTIQNLPAIMMQCCSVNTSSET